MCVRFTGRIARTAALAGVILAAMALTGSVVESRLSARDAVAYPPPGRLIDMGGGRRMHLNCMGQGAPAVILEAGLSGWSQDWSSVQSALSRATRVCSYDRAGYGWSDEAASPPTAAAAIQDLSRLLDAAGVPRDRILVGHSMGGLLVQAYAETHRDEIKGLVFVDSIQRDQSRLMSPSDSSIYRSEMGGLADLGVVIAPIGLTRLVGFPASLIGARLPPDQRASARAVGVRAKAFRSLRAEFNQIDATLDFVNAHGALPRVPTVVLGSRALRDLPPGWDSPQMRALWVGGQQRLGRDAGVKPVMIDGAGHYLHIERPEVVETAVLAVLHQARGGAPPR